jgi:integrase
MKGYRTPVADPTKILTRRELAAVLADLTRKAKRSPSTRLNLVIFRLATCCGLRASEIAQLQLGDVRTEANRPHIRIRKGAAKGGRGRMVPLWWDGGTLEDLRAWKAERLDEGADYDDPFVAPLHADKPFSRHTLRSAIGPPAGCWGRNGSKR